MKQSQKLRLGAKVNSGHTLQSGSKFLLKQFLIKTEQYKKHISTPWLCSKAFIPHLPFRRVDHGPNKQTIVK